MRSLLFLLLPLVPACLVNDPIAEDEDSTSAQTRVAEKAADWCTTTCTRLKGCEDVLQEGCPEECQKFIEDEFLSHGDACAEAGERYMNCFSDVVCSDLESGDLCEPSDADQAACDEDDQPPSSGDPGAPDPVPGSVPVSCESGGGSGTAPGGSEFVCDLDWTDCDDGSSYGIACSGTTAAPPTCTCLHDGLEVGSFDLVSLECPSIFDVNAGCGFYLTDGVPPEATVCSGPSGGGGDGESCSMMYLDCDGHDYRVECSSTELCTCYVDDEAQGSFRSPAGICPSSGEEKLQVNRGCGWYLL